MKKTYIFNFIFFLSLSISAQSITGKWISLDKNGKETAIIYVYEDTNIFYAKILDILDKNERQKKCEKCYGEYKDKPIVGLTIIKDLKYNKDTYSNGYKLDYSTGDIEDCRIIYSKETPNMLTVESTEVSGFKSKDSIQVTTSKWKRMVL